MKALIFTLWLVAFIWISSFLIQMINAANTIENIVGFIALVSIIILSVKTRCLTKFYKRKWKN